MPIDDLYPEQKKDAFWRPGGARPRGYDPDRNAAMTAGTNSMVGSRWGGVWDSVRKEWGAMSQPSTPGQLSFAGDVADLGRKAAGLIPGGVTANPQIDRLRLRESMIGPQEPNFDTRARRIEQFRAGSDLSAHPASAAPVMANGNAVPAREEIGLRGENLPPQEGGRGNVSPQPPLSESSRASSSAVVGAAGAGRGAAGPTISASDKEYLGRQPVTADPRKRYFDMANMSLEQRESYLNSLPEGQRPIQTIRGNREAWYSPGMSKEFDTIPEAMSGVEGRPTLKSEMGREEEARDRAALVDIAASRNKTALAAEGMRQAGSDRRHVAEGKGKGHSGWDTFVQKGVDDSGNPVEKTMVWNKEIGPHTIIEPKTTPAKAIVSAITGDFENDKARDGWLPMFEYLDPQKVAEIATTLPPPVKAYYREAIAKRAAQKAQEEKTKAKGN